MIKAAEGRIACVPATIRILEVNNRPMKLATLKQVPMADLLVLEVRLPCFAGEPLGWINQSWKEAGRTWPCSGWKCLLWRTEAGEPRICDFRAGHPVLSCLPRFVIKPLSVVPHGGSLSVLAAPEFDNYNFWRHRLATTLPEDRWDEPPFGMDSGPSLKYANLNDQMAQMKLRAQPIYDAAAKALRDAHDAYMKRAQELESELTRLPQLYTG